MTVDVEGLTFLLRIWEVTGLVLGYTDMDFLHFSTPEQAQYIKIGSTNSFYILHIRSAIRHYITYSVKKVTLNNVEVKVKVKVKLSLCFLTDHQAMKA
jgi:hypothetical protein